MASDGIETAAEAAAVAGLAAEAAKAQGPHGAEDGSCHNCGATLTGPYCAACGQKAMDMHRPIHEFVEDILHSILHFDSRMWMTLKGRFLQPGQLTIDWMEGKQAGRVPPVRMFLFLVFVMLAVFAVSDVALVRIGGSMNLQERSVKEMAGGAKVNACPVIKGDKALCAAPDGDADPEVFVLSIVPEAAQHKQVLDPSKMSVNSDNDKDRKALNSFAEFLNLAAAEPKKVSGLITGSLTKFMVIAVPIMAIFLKLLYIRRKRLLIEHLIFALHAHTTFFTGLLVCVVLVWVTRGWVHGGALMWALWGLFSLHFLIALKRVYGQGWVKTFFKSAVLMWLYTTALMSVGIWMIVRAFT